MCHDGLGPEDAATGGGCCEPAGGDAAAVLFPAGSEAPLRFFPGLLTMLTRLGARGGELEGGDQTEHERECAVVWRAYA